ncbi:MAG: hypothetical protein GY869_02850 [Planctomycetes bacterium]|nr:hypothetical protein [Planctomycetota bacterium]
MAGKGYRPALFELVRKGPLKPNQKGTLTTPKWFYKGNNDVTVEPLRRETKSQDNQTQDFSADYIDDIADHSTPETYDRPESIIGLQLADKKLALWAPYWAIGLAIMGLLLSFLVVFWLGQISVRGSATTVNPPNQAQASLDENGVEPDQQGEFGLAANTIDKTTVANGESQAANIAKATVESVTPPVTSEVSTGRNCLVVCGNPSQRELRSVQEYYSTKGVLTKIGRFKGSYIVYCQEGYDRSNSLEARSFRDRMVEIGKRYNREKPRGAAGFLPSTFDSAYWALRDSITIIEQ